MSGSGEQRQDGALKPSQKFEDLELLRGLAAVGVIIYHFNRGFLPPANAPQAAHTLGLVAEPPLVLSLFNGPFMVAIFFVLSSYALTFRLVNESRPRSVVLAIAKRLPRLLPLAFIGALFAGLLNSAGLMFNRRAAPLTGSEWLTTTGGVKTGSQWSDPSLLGSAWDGVWLFVSGISQYNAALWTMRLELVGGILALVTAGLIAGRWVPIRDLLIVAVLGIIGLIMHPLCAVCVGTVLVTKFLRHHPILFSARVAVPLLAFGLAVGSTYYAFEAMLEEGPFAPQAERLQWLLHGLGALIVFLGVHGWRRLRDRPQPFGRWLGRLSFSTYVLHMPVIASAGAGIIMLLGYSGFAVAVALATSLAVIFLLSIPLSAFDAWWVRTLNSTAARLAGRKRMQRATAVAADAP